MKKLIFFGVIFISSVSLFAQTADKIETEYYGLKWGCSPAELKAKYPSAYHNGKNDNGDDLYYLDTGDETRVFFFGNNKFYIGRIVYVDCTYEKGLALIKKIIDTYGQFDDSSKGSSNGNEYHTFINHYSSKITISCELITIKNAYGYSISENLMITYTNNALKSQIQQDRINKMQDDLEI